MRTADEWIQGFNLLWNNIFSDKAPGLDVYEISMFCTLGQEALVKDVFSGKTNLLGEGFDDSARRQSDFRSLIVSEKLDVYTSGSEDSKFNTRSTTKYFVYPEKAFIVLNEEVSVDEKYATVVPVSYSEYARLMMRPYKYPPKGQVWRLLTNTDQEASSGSGSADPDPAAFQIIELIGNFGNSEIDYRMRYVKRPTPIILEDLSDRELSIEGENEPATPYPCLLPEHLHDEILARAINLAKIAWIDTAAPQAQKQ